MTGHVQASEPAPRIGAPLPAQARLPALVYPVKAPQDFI
jgi:hypothetical protein